MTATQDAPAPVAEIGRDRRRKEDQRRITGCRKTLSSARAGSGLRTTAKGSPSIVPTSSVTV